MPRPKKDARNLNIKLDREIFEKLERFCEESGQSKTVAVERALKAYLDNYDDKQKLLKQIENNGGSF